MEKYVDLEPFPNDSVCYDCRDRYLINHFADTHTGRLCSETRCSICYSDRPKFGLFFSIPKCELRNIKIDLINGI
jgi:hypothetical protein